MNTVLVAVAYGALVLIVAGAAAAAAVIAAEIRSVRRDIRVELARRRRLLAERHRDSV